MCQNHKLTLHKKITIMANNKGHIKVVVCRKPEERRTIVQKDILQQMEQKPVPTLIFCNSGELSEWTKGLIKAADITPGAYSPEKAKEITEKMDAIAKLPLYLFEEKSFDIGWISWKLYSNIEKLGIKKIYIENLESFDIVDPFDEEYVNASQEPIPEDLTNELKKALGDLYTDQPFGKEDSEKSLKAQHITMVVEILRHIVDQYGIDLTIVMDNDLCTVPKAELYPDVLTNPYYIKEFVDEIIIDKETL